MHHMLLIDGNSIGFSAHSATKLTSGDLETQAIFGSLRTVRTLLEDYGTKTEPIVYWDGRSWRKDICSDYKANREDDPKKVEIREGYKRQRPHIGKGLALLGVRQKIAGNLEADDLIALETHTMLDGVHRATIISGDRDLWQLVRPNVSWHTPIRMPNGQPPRVRTVHAGDFHEITGYATSLAYVQGKALLGDASDNLKGVTGIGEKAAPLILDFWGNVPMAIKRLRESRESCIPSALVRHRKKLLDFVDSPEEIERFKRNMRLMHLSPGNIPKPEGFRDLRRSFDADGFHDFCEEWGFVSILREFDKWTRPFRECAEANSEAA